MQAGAEPVAEPVAALGIARLSDVAAIVSALVAVVVRRGYADAIGNEIESDQCPGNIPESFGLICAACTPGDRDCWYRT